MSFGPPRDERRYGLLPTWIRIFSWLFLIGGLVALILPLMWLTSSDVAVSLRLYGLRTSGAADDPATLAVATVVLLNGVAAYGLLWGRPWGLSAGLIAGVGGLIIAVVTTFTRSGPEYVQINLEPVLQIPFIIQLWNRRLRWANADADGGRSPGAPRPLGYETP